MKTLLMQTLSLSITSVFLTGCAAPSIGSAHDERDHDPANHWFQPNELPGLRQAQYLSPKDPLVSYEHHDLDAGFRSGPVADAELLPATPLLSPGDRLRLDLPPKVFFNGVFKTTDDALIGIYEVDFDGRIKLPYVNPVAVSGLSLYEAENLINQTYEHRGYFRKGMARLSLTVQQWAPVQIPVSGAVFSPGLITVNFRNAELSGQQLQLRGGSTSLNRLLTKALQGAGGVRPDAAIHSIELIRNQRVFTIDLSGTMAGHSIGDVALIQGDQIRVPSLALPNPDQIRPSAITPPGIRVFISNLTAPALDNASSTVGEHSTSLPYGSQLHTAVVSGNCAGGAVSTNSDRYAVLVTRDPVTQRPVTIERRVEQVLSRPGDRVYNPYLMPNDSVVCYDSRVTNLREIGRTISDLLGPLGWFIR